MTIRFSHGAGVAIVATLFAGCSGAGSVPQQSMAAASASRPATLNAHMYPLGQYGANVDIDSLHAASRTGSHSYKVKAGSKLVYICNLGGGAVDVFDQTGKTQQPIASITDGILGPGGLTTD